MNIRRTTRALLDRVAALSGVLHAYEAAMHNGVTILTYHRILPESRCRTYHLPSLATPVSVFREQLRYLAERFRIVTVQEGIRLIRDDKVGGRPLLSLTFDDGYADNHALAMPVLAEFNVPATFYVTSGLVGTRQRFWFDEAAIVWSNLGAECLHKELGRLLGGQYGDHGLPLTTIPDFTKFLKSLETDQRKSLLDDLRSDMMPPLDELDRLMTPDEIRELAELGHEIGSHSVTHPLLPQLSDAELEIELVHSRQHIATMLGLVPEGFCYPNGDHDERIVNAVRKAGYGYACTTKSGRNDSAQDHFLLLRVDMSPSRVTKGEVHDLLTLRGEISLLHNALR